MKKLINLAPTVFPINTMNKNIKESILKVLDIKIYPISAIICSHFPIIKPATHSIVSRKSFLSLVNDTAMYIRHPHITDFKNKLGDLQWKEENGEITNQAYISFQARQLNEMIDRLQRAYNPNTNQPEY